MVRTLEGGRSEAERRNPPSGYLSLPASRLPLGVRMPNRRDPRHRATGFGDDFLAQTGAFMQARQVMLELVGVDDEHWIKPPGSQLRPSYNQVEPFYRNRPRRVELVKVEQTAELARALAASRIDLVVGGQAITPASLPRLSNLKAFSSVKEMVAYARTLTPREGTPAGRRRRPRHATTSHEK